MSTHDISLEDLTFIVHGLSFVLRDMLVDEREWSDYDASKYARLNNLYQVMFDSMSSAQRAEWRNSPQVRMSFNVEK